MISTPHGVVSAQGRAICGAMMICLLKSFPIRMMPIGMISNIRGARL